MSAFLHTRSDIPAKKWRMSTLLAGLSLAGALAVWPAGAVVGPVTLLSANFDTGTDDFTYQDDTFGTTQPSYASGARTSNGGYNGTGGLQVTLGGINNNSITGMSGGWSYTLNLAAARTGVVLSFRYKLTQSATYEYDEYSRVLVVVDEDQYGRGAKDYVDHIGGDGQGTQGNSNTYLPTTDWQQVEIYLGDLTAGDHDLVIGGYNNKKTLSDEFTTLVIDEVLITSDNPAPTASDVQTLVGRLDADRFLDYIRGVALFNDRCRLSGCASTDYFDALGWVEGQLQDMGYATVRHPFTSNGGGTNLWATKAGSETPTEMYMVSAHLDGRGGGDGFDDDGSGVALVLEAARVFAGEDVTTDKSVRFIFWDKEEVGLYGSGAYASNNTSAGGRFALQGTLDEPTWLGLIQHDMILYDHGAGTRTTAQSLYADLDVEWRAGTTQAAASQALALKWAFRNGDYATDYPATAYNYSTNTDDTPFHPYVASISVRENRRSLTSNNNGNVAEWINPYYHQTTDVESSYTRDDIELGFNAVQTTVGLVAELAGVQIVPANTAPTAHSQSVVTPEDTALTITLTGSDPEGDDLAFEVVGYTSDGVLSGTPPNLSYTPNSNWSGSDSFTFTVSDGEFTSAPATVSITITPVDDPPVANAQTVVIAEDVTTAIILTGADPEGDPLTAYTLASPPSFGTLSGTAPSLIYTPNPGFSGTDSFTFTVTAGGLTSAPGTVLISVTPVNKPPVADPQSLTMDQDTVKAITLTGSDPDGDPLTYYIVSGPAHGVLGGSPPNLTYTPNPGYSGSDSLRFGVTDGALTAEADIGITVLPAILKANFDGGTDRFEYGDDRFRGTSQPAYADGTWRSADGYTGGAINVRLGGINNAVINNMSGGWQRQFTLPTAQTVTLSLRYRLSITSFYESDEYGQALVGVDGILHGNGGADYLAQLNGGGPTTDTGWQFFTLSLPLAAGTHTVTVGGFNNQKNYRNEATAILFDDLLIE